MTRSRAVRSLCAITVVAGFLVGAMASPAASKDDKPTAVELRKARKVAKVLGVFPTRKFLRSVVTSSAELCGLLKNLARDEFDVAAEAFVRGIDDPLIVEGALASVGVFCRKYRARFAVAIEAVPTTTVPTTTEGSTEPTAPPTTLSALDLAESHCVDLRTKWENNIVNHFPRAERIRAQYRSDGCYELCGDMVEDTDIPGRERFC